jgi:hypothetical protein
MKSKQYKKKVCVLSFENIELEYRVRNQIIYLSSFFNIDFLGIGEWEPPKEVQYTKLIRTKKNISYYILYVFLLITGRIFPYFYQFVFDLKSEYREAKQKIQMSNFDIIHANEWDALFIAVKASLGKDKKIIFDAHELSTEQESESFVWKTLVKPFREWILKKYISKADKVITVSDPIAEIYTKNYGIDNVFVTYNTKPYLENLFRKSDPDLIKIIHHGAAIRNRKLESIIELSDLVDNRFIISLMLTPQDKHYFNYLKHLCETKNKTKINFIDCVKHDQINNILIKYDIGIPAIAAVNKNHQFALGSRVFDYMMAGLAIAVPPLRAYKEVVDKYKIGVFGSNMALESLADVLNNTSANQFDKYKKNSLKAAKRLCLEQENRKLSNIYKDLIDTDQINA